MNQTQTSGWRYFPHWSIAALGVVVVVNVYMAYCAIHSFPGTATEADFATSNRYDAVLAAEAQQKALGWQADASVDAGRAVIVLQTREGKKLEGARVVALAQRPAGGEADHRLDFRATTPGRYVADSVLPEHGQWELQVYASVNGREFRVTRRILMP